MSKSTKTSGRRKSTKRAVSRNGQAKQPVLERTTLRTSRLLDFLSPKELIAQIGHSPPSWPLVLVKELVDNALDACEEARIAPEISVHVDKDGIRVQDNGSGIPPEVVEDILDFSSRTSSREAYVAPDRGAQGNALKTVIAMPYVLNGTSGQIEVTSRGVRHAIRLSVDRIRQEPILDHNTEEHRDTGGTSVFVGWPNASSDGGAQSSDKADFGELEDDSDDDELEETDFGKPDSASSILAAAKSRFLQIADDFTILNPHLSLTVDWHGERIRTESRDTEWRKWLPSNPTSAHWYTEEHFERLVAGYVAHDQDHGQDRTVRALVSEFEGLASTAKQKRVLEASGLTRQPLSEMVNGTELDRRRLGELLLAMKELTKPVKPARLGPIGKDHIRQRFEELGGEMESFQYKKIQGVIADVPWIAETAFVWCPDADRRRLITGVNWSPGILNPFRELGQWGQSLDTILSHQKIDRNDPVVMLLHLICPRVEYTDRGKSAVVIPD